MPGSPAPWRPRPPLSRNAVARLVQAAGAYNAITAILPARTGRIAALAEYVPAAGILSPGPRPAWSGCC
jgi:lysyl-tRNA synthetase class 2